MIPLESARRIVAAALEYARERGLPPMTVAVLGADGQLVSFAREDGSSLLREKIARGKATGALGMGMDSRELAARAEAHPAFIASVTALAGGALVPVPGGVLVRQDGVVIGAVGVSGHLPDDDEACALAGIAAAELAAEAEGASR